MKSLWRTHRWWVIGALSLLAFILGYIGATKQLVPAGQRRTLLDPFYRALQLFVMEDGMASGYPMPWEFETARWLAPAVAAYTAVAAVAALFSEKLQALKLRRYKNHVVICGLGGKGARLVKDFYLHGDRVVAIERNDSIPEVAGCREEGITVLTGDPSHPALLSKARVHRAKCLIAICAEDGTNVEIAAQTQHLLGEAKSSKDNRGERTLCLVHLTAPRLRNLIEQTGIQGPLANRLEVRFFNVYENGARALLTDYPPDRFTNLPHHVLVIGFNQLGESVVLQAARTGHYASGKKLRITVIDQQAQKREAAFRLRYPMLDEVVEARFLQMEMDGPGFLACGFLVANNQGNAVAIAYVCLDSDVEGVCAALTLLRGLGKNPAPVVVCMAGDDGLARLVEYPDLRDSHRAHAFRLNAAACRREIILGETQDVLAIAIHAAYVSKQKSEGATPRDNPYVVDWADLPEAMKESNRHQADHIPVKLRAIGCVAEPVAAANAASFEFKQEEIELLARMEHARWNAERFLAGWRYAPGVKDVEKKTSPYLTSWENLTEEIKDYDRNTVRQLPEFLAVAGLQIRRPR